MDELVYLPGDAPERPTPLARYLPPIPDGVAAAFLAQQASLPAGSGVTPGSWILDPFGASPRLAVEMARRGYGVLVATNNPITRFLLEMAANPPSQADLQGALADLAAARKGDERLETHLQSLYMTTCTQCHAQVPAEAFIWERQSGALVGRIYQCPCGEGGEYPATEADQTRAAQLAANDSLHRARALERVAAPDDPDRIHAAEALECYLPRAVYALITIINKFESLSLPPERRRALLGLVLTACDEASALWPHPAERPRPKQLNIPPRFLEKNVWLALERGVELWFTDEKVIPLVEWPELPHEAGSICLFDGPMRELAPQLRDFPLNAIITVLPRPNQAFWTLSALWAGWLWGREAAAPFKSVLRRRRYDWNWHATALHATLKNLTERLPLNAPFFALLPELEPPLLSAALLAAAGAGFDLSGLALRSRHDPAQVVWHRRAFAHEDQQTAEIDPQAVRQALQLALRERGEPLPYLYLHAAGLAFMASDHSLRWQEEALTEIHAPIQAALDEAEFVHYAESPNPESGLWGLAKWDIEADPLPDRMEVAVVQFLQKHPGITQRDLEAALNADFPGLLTPSLGLLRAVLVSYAIETDGSWSLRPEDSPAARHADLESAAQSLAALGSRLGFSLQREDSPRRILRWQQDGETAYTFYLLASAVVGQLLRSNPLPAANSFLVLPGGRAGLLSYKLERDPGLKSIAERWRVVKFRHLRRMAEMTRLTRQRFEQELSADPIEAPEQMKLF